MKMPYWPYSYSTKCNYCYHGEEFLGLINSNQYILYKKLALDKELINVKDIEMHNTAKGMLAEKKGEPGAYQSG